MIRRGDQGLRNGFRAPPKISNCSEDREEELSFFRDLQKREKDQAASLLQPVSEEFEANGNYELYRMESGGRKGPGTAFLAETGKNDYNWLKTPPATPLFPSLEMEANAPQEHLVIHKELPIIQPLSRFAANAEGKKTSDNRPTSPNNPKPRLPRRHKTPTGRPSISSSMDKKNMKTAPETNNAAATTSLPYKMKPSFTPVVKSNTILQKESRPNFLALNLSKSIGTESDTNAKLMLKSRGVSPFGRPTVPGFSDETPPNLKTTNRPASATRGRPRNENLTLPQKQDTTAKTRRQSCSPSVTRGRKVDTTAINSANTPKIIENRGQVFGSQMLDKFMNARISSVIKDRQAKITKISNSMNESSCNSKDENRRAKIKLNGSVIESSGFGRLMSKSSLDMALKHMEFQQEASNIRKHGVLHGRKS